MKRLFTLIVLFASIEIMAQTAFPTITIENKTNGTVVGSVTIDNATSYYLNGFEIKVKKETTPTSGGIQTWQQGVAFMTTESAFKTLNWNGKTETGSWSTDGVKYTRTITNSAWQTTTYKLELQPYNASGNVGSAIVNDWTNFSSKELTAVYTAEGCTVPKDSTKATKWKSEAKIKTSTAITKTGFTIGSAADSLRVTLKDANNNVVFTFKYAIIKVDPTKYGLNPNLTLASPINGSFYVPTETFNATIELKNDAGDILKLNEGSTNKLEKLEVWISGPKQAYKHVPNYKQVKVVDAFVFNTAAGVDAATNKMAVTLDAASNLEAGTYTMLLKAKRNGYGPTYEKYLLKDFQVKTANVTTNPTEAWNTKCESCHTFKVKHSATDLKQCYVCHNNSFSGYEFSAVMHKVHGGKTITNCLKCHTNSAGNDIASKAACGSCHNGTITKAIPTTHTADIYQNCSMCHSSGAISPDQAHSKIMAIRTDEAIPTKTSLEQNYPNPFNPSTVIKFSLSKSEHVRLEIFNLLGQSLEVLVDSKLSAGNYIQQWNAKNLASGIYIYRLQTDSYTEARKMILMR